MTTWAEPPPLYERVTRGGVVGLRCNWHEGQRQALRSKKRVVAVIAGGRSGKTVLGPMWLYREMLRMGPGDYLVSAPTYPLLDKAAAPELEAFLGRMLGLGTLKRSPMQFTFSPKGCQLMGWGTPSRPPRVIFAHADNPEGLEAMSARAAWLDEAGQSRFRVGSWHAVLQRLSIDRGRCLITTKPYVVAGWLRREVYDPWHEARRAGLEHPEIDVINFGSLANPAMPPDEVERARSSLPRWKFRRDYEGAFERPAGLIYEVFSESTHVVDPFPVPHDWERLGGIDFGGVNTAAVILSRHPRTGQLYLIAEYHRGGLTARGHAEQLLALARRGWSATAGGRPPAVKLWVGGSKSEGQWRREFAQAGLPVHEPAVSDVEVGIGRVHAMFAESPPLQVFRSCADIIDDLQSYSREVDDSGEPTERIADKESWHRLDALRYIASRVATAHAARPIKPHSIATGGALGKR